MMQSCVSMEVLAFPESKEGIPSPNARVVEESKDEADTHHEVQNGPAIGNGKDK